MEKRIVSTSSYTPAAMALPAERACRCRDPFHLEALNRNGTVAIARRRFSSAATSAVSSDKLSQVLRFSLKKKRRQRESLSDDMERASCR